MLMLLLHSHSTYLHPSLHSSASVALHFIWGIQCRTTGRQKTTKSFFFRKTLSVLAVCEILALQPSYNDRNVVVVVKKQKKRRIAP